MYPKTVTFSRVNETQGFRISIRNITESSRRSSLCSMDCLLVFSIIRLSHAMARVQLRHPPSTDMDWILQKTTPCSLSIRIPLIRDHFQNDDDTAASLVLPLHHLSSTTVCDDVPSCKNNNMITTMTQSFYTQFYSWMADKFHYVRLWFPSVFKMNDGVNRDGNNDNSGGNLVQRDDDDAIYITITSSEQTFSRVGINTGILQIMLLPVSPEPIPTMWIQFCFVMLVVIGCCCPFVCTWCLFWCCICSGGDDVDRGPQRGGQAADTKQSLVHKNDQNVAPINAPLSHIYLGDRVLIGLV